MRGYWMLHSILVILIFMLAGCSDVPKSDNLKKLTRVEYESVHTNKAKNIITDKKTLEKIEQIFHDVKWEKNTRVDMSREEDVHAIFFYTDDQNKGEKPSEYRIWFSAQSGEVVGDNNEHSYGMIKEEDAHELQKRFPLQ